MDYIYLHGFASGPQSYKGQWLKSHLYAQDIDLKLLDLNQGNFGYLTLTRQIQQVRQQLQGPTILIGSSLGGLVAAWVAEQSDRVEKLVLLAPAFQFLDQWLPRLGDDQIRHWRSTGWLSVYHYGFKSRQRLHYTFLRDAQDYLDSQLQKTIPTLILHGTQDDVIALDASQQYAQTRPWVTLQALNTNHGMTSVMAEIGHSITDFCHL
ncbi:MAG: YqiA/YcfP family alpha/beta fold hydrolase [Cyanobacteria bacterium P01_D01_bin.156]